MRARLARRRWLTLTFALVALMSATVLASCSDGDDGADSTTTSAPPPETTTPPTTEQPGERMFVFSLGPGECFDQRVVVEDDQEVPADVVVDCAGPHMNEVFVAIDHPAPPGEGYPDEAGWSQFLTEQCYSQFETFVGQVYELSTLQVGHRKPTPESWASEPDRQVVCWVYDPTGAKITGTVQGSAR
jgi:hypothetical protein